MASYSVATSKHAVLVAATVDTVSFTTDWPAVHVENRGPAGDIYFTIDGSTPVSGADNTYVLTPGEFLTVTSNYSGDAVKLISSGTPGYSVSGVDGGFKKDAAGSGTVDTELPAAAALSDTLANPTTPQIGADTLVWDSTNSQWVRARVLSPNNDGAGVQLVAAPPSTGIRATGSANATTTATVSAPGAGKFLVATFALVSFNAAVTTSASFTIDDGTATLFQAVLATNSISPIGFPLPAGGIKTAAANRPLNFSCAALGVSVTSTVSGAYITI